MLDYCRRHPLAIQVINENKFGESLSVNFENAEPRSART